MFGNDKKSIFAVEIVVHAKDPEVIVKNCPSVPEADSLSIVTALLSICAVFTVSSVAKTPALSIVEISWVCAPSATCPKLAPTSL